MGGGGTTDTIKASLGRIPSTFPPSVIASVWGVRSKSFFQYIYFNGSRTHAVTMPRTELTGAQAKKRGRERA